VTGSLRSMRFLPRSKARRNREALEAMGRMMGAGFAEGIRQEETRMAAIPDGVDREEWRRVGIAEAMAALDANPLYQRMMARTRAFWALPEPEQPVAPAERN
jgi:tRNA A37 N6-isopentenylltransferase MiaA